jgi:hypothetical protein
VQQVVQVIPDSSRALPDVAAFCWSGRIGFFKNNPRRACNSAPSWLRRLKRLSTHCAASKPTDLGRALSEIARRRSIRPDRISIPELGISARLGR